MPTKIERRKEDRRIKNRRELLQRRIMDMTIEEIEDYGHNFDRRGWKSRRKKAAGRGAA